MGVLGFRANKEVPLELPDLISDEIEKESFSNATNSHEEKPLYPADNSTLRHISSLPAKKNIEDYRTGVQESQVILEGLDEDLDKGNISEKNEVAAMTPPNPPAQNDISVQIKEAPQKESPPINYCSEKSFFNSLQENLEKEISDISSLEEWYKSKFSSRDMLGDMRSYWEKQKMPSIMEALGKNFQSKISQKIQALQDLERQWQNTYFELIGKEEEIKDAEQELKSTLSEFVKICKHKKDNLEDDKKEAKKEDTEAENKTGEQKNIQEEKSTD